MMMIMKGCGGNLRAAAGGDLAPDPRGAADFSLAFFGLKTGPRAQEKLHSGYCSTKAGTPGVC